MRHLFILFAIVFVYFMPDIALQTYGSPWFAYHSLWSLGLIALIRADKSQYIDAIIILEIFATTITLVACMQSYMSLKTASIYSQYSTIMTSIFIAELAIMGVVMLNDGIRKSLSILRIPHFDNRKSKFSIVYAREATVCTIR